MAEELSQREVDKIYVATNIKWMQDAFKNHPGDLHNMLVTLHATFFRMVESYEAEIECLKHALPADNNTQINSLPAPVDSVEE